MLGIIAFIRGSKSFDSFIGSEYACPVHPHPYIISFDLMGNSRKSEREWTPQASHREKRTIRIIIFPSI